MFAVVLILKHNTKTVAEYFTMTLTVHIISEYP
jgi:hypothetical protein